MFFFSMFVHLFFRFIVVVHFFFQTKNMLWGIEINVFVEQQKKKQEQQQQQQQEQSPPFIYINRILREFGNAGNIIYWRILCSSRIIIIFDSFTSNGLSLLTDLRTKDMFRGKDPDPFLFIVKRYSRPFNFDEKHFDWFEKNLLDDFDVDKNDFDKTKNIICGDDDDQNANAAIVHD